MARTKKPSGNDTLKTGNDFINHAEQRGAVVQKDRRGGFTEVSTPAGSTYIAPGTKTLDPRTRKNLRHWFRLLGLLALIAGTVLCLFPQLLGALLGVS
jgi:hypothetical protein